jgi:uncharacterized protein Usg
MYVVTGSTTPTELMLHGYVLTLAKLYYRMPDFISVLNVFMWQEYDLALDYPKLFDFIKFWQNNLDGLLHSVSFIHRKKIGWGKWQNVVHEITLH